MIGIIFTLIGIIAIVVCSIQVYKTASDTGRSSSLWTIITVGIGIFFQFLLPVILGIIIGIVMLIRGTPPNEMTFNVFGLVFIIEVGCLVLSIVGMFSVLRRVSTYPEETESAVPAPPPPPTFT